MLEISRNEALPGLLGNRGKGHFFSGEQRPTNNGNTGNFGKQGT